MSEEEAQQGENYTRTRHFSHSTPILPLSTSQIDLCDQAR